MAAARYRRVERGRSRSRIHKEVQLCKETSVPSPWLKVSQAREYLQMDNGALRRLIKSGEIRSVRRGNTTFVRTDWLDTWMESLPSGAAPLATVVGGATSRAS